MRIATSCALALGVALVVVAVAFPQTGAPSFVQVTTTVVKPSMVAEYEDYVKKIGAGATKIALTQRVSAYQVTQGTSPYTYLFAARLANWAAFDSLPSVPQILAKAYGEAEGAKILKAGRAAIESTQIEVYRYRPELSTHFKMFDPIPAFGYMIRTEVKPDMVAPYTEYVSKLKAAQEQVSGHPTANRVTSVQGAANVFLTVQYFDKFAERDTWPNPGEALQKSVGEAEARRLTESSNRAIAKREFWVSRYRPDLSRGGARATSN